MTRSTIRLAQICAAAIGAGVLAAALAQSTRAGLASTARYLVIVAATGAVASAAWHGTAAAVERHEERKRAERRHRVPRPDRAPRPVGDSGPSQPHMATRPRTPATADPYAEQYAPPWPGTGWPEPGPARVDDPYEDLYAHPSTGPA